MLTKRETGIDYAFLFKSVKEGIKTYFSDISWERKKFTDRKKPSALNKQNDDNDYTESSTRSNAEKSPDTNQILNNLGLGDSNTEDKTNESNDTAND